jgi:uncharacterized membrane protein YphA (DoxX/SURF4 family)
MQADTIAAVRRRVGSALVTITGLLLMSSSMTKFLGVPAVVRQLDGFGFTGLLFLIATLEMTGGALLLIPRLRALGIALASAFLGGAVATHLQHGQLPLPPGILLGLLWFGVWLRYPVALRTLHTTSFASAP